MNKKTVLISACPNIISGYGQRSRHLVWSLFDLMREDYDIKILSQRWGNCPDGLLDPNNPKDKEILDHIVPPNVGLAKQPDVFIQVSVTNEVPDQKIGKYANWIFSAGTEGDIYPSHALQGLNRSDLAIFSSQFGKEVACKTTFNQHAEHTGNKIGELKFNGKATVLFEGVDTSVYKRLEQSKFDLSMITESFCFITTAHVLQGFQQMQDRKNLGALIKIFLETFKNKPVKPALILKSSLAGYSILEEQQLLDQIDGFRKTVNSKDLPNIYLVHGNLSDDELNEMYNHPKVKAFVLCSNEGYGRPFLEFSAGTSKPIITSPYSGQVDFLHKEFNIFVGGNLHNVEKPGQNDFIIEGSKLFRPDPYQLSQALDEVYKNYDNYITMGKRQGHRSRTDFSLEKMTESLKNIIAEHLPVIPKQVSIKLPTLKRVELPKNDLVVSG